jgi:hypothetical protein
MDIETGSTFAAVDCACVIHSDGYDWQYVEKLYNMVSRNISKPVRFHVYTEADRAVPDTMIKHVLTEWPGVAGPKQSWWYKMQLFDNTHFSGQLLYFDLDVVITGNLDWILTLSQRNFWAIHDFKRLWKHSSRTINSSVMYFDTKEYQYVWNQFQQQSLTSIMSKYKGDQDFITDTVNPRHLRYFDLDRVLSWRWQIVNDGVNKHRLLERTTIPIKIPESASILVFHGDPKPHCVNDSVIIKYWS